MSYRLDTLILDTPVNYPYTMNRDTERSLRRAAARAATATDKRDAAVARRDELIRLAIAEGGSLRTVADAAGVSHQTVKNVVARAQ